MEKANNYVQNFKTLFIYQLFKQFKFLIVITTLHYLITTTDIVIGNGH